MPGPAWAHALLHSARLQLDGCSMQALSGLLWACCKLGVKPGPSWMAAAMRVRCAAVQLLPPPQLARTSAAHAQQLRNGADNACGLRRRAAVRGAAAVWAQVVEARAGELCGASLPLLLWALASLGFNPGLAWSKALTQRAARLPQRMRPQALAACVAALARLRLPAHPAWTAAAVARAQQLLAPPAPQQQQRGAAAVAGGPPATLAPEERFTPLELSMCLRGWARLGVAPGPRCLEAAEQLLLSWLLPLSQPQQQQREVGRGGVSSGHLAGCLYALARLGHVAGEPLLHAATSALLVLVPRRAAASTSAASAEARPQLEAVDGEEEQRRGDAQAAAALDLAQGCWALAMLGHVPPPPQLAALAALAPPLMPRMRHAELAQCAWALHRMGLAAPGAEWVRALLMASQAEMLRVLQRPRAAPAPPGGDAGDGAGDGAQAMAEGSPLLSVATLLRTLAAWAPAAAPPLAAACPRWLPLAGQLLDVEAATWPCATQEGPLPLLLHSTSGGGGAQALPPPPGAEPGPLGEHPLTRHHHHHHQHVAQQPARPLSPPPPSGSNGGGDGGGRVSVVVGLGAAAVPHAYEAGRLSALSLSEVTISRKVARRRLWRQHRGLVLQRHKVMEAARRAWGALWLQAAHGAEPAQAAAAPPQHLGGERLGGRSTAAQQQQQQQQQQAVVGRHPGRRGRVAEAEGCNGAPSRGSGDDGASAAGNGLEQQEFFDGVLYAAPEQDARYMPW